MRREQEGQFEEFVAAAGPRLLRLAFLLTGDHGHAEDLLQTGLERTARHWSRLQGAPEAYARKVLANLATDRWRRRAARAHEVYVSPPEAGCHDPASSIALRQAVLAALRQLPPRQRAVLVLRFFEDLSEAETAQLLGIGVGTVKSATSRGLARLRDSTHLLDSPTPASPANGMEVRP